MPGGATVRPMRQATQRDGRRRGMALRAARADRLRAAAVLGNGLAPLPVARLAGRQPRHAARRCRRPPPAVGAGLRRALRAGDGAVFPGRFAADDLRRLPVRLAAGRRPCGRRRDSRGEHAVPRRAHRFRRLPARQGRGPGRQLLERLRGGRVRLSAGLRLAPFVPFFVVNIAPALCGVRPRVFVAATAIGILPGALAYSWLGQGLDSVLAAGQGGRPGGLHPRSGDAADHDRVRRPCPCRAARRHRKTPASRRARRENAAEPLADAAAAGNCE